MIDGEGAQVKYFLLYPSTTPPTNLFFDFVLENRHMFESAGYEKNRLGVVAFITIDDGAGWYHNYSCNYFLFIRQHQQVVSSIQTLIAISSWRLKNTAVDN